MKYKKTIGERCFAVFNTTLMIFLAVIMLYPFLYVLMLSLTPYSEAVKAGLSIIPKKITFEAYA